MKVTDVTKNRLARAREEKAMKEAGWEWLPGDGGNLYELHRGCRIGMKIIDCRVSVDGVNIWVKVGGESIRQQIKRETEVIKN